MKFWFFLVLLLLFAWPVWAWFLLGLFSPIGIVIGVFLIWPALFIVGAAMWVGGWLAEKLGSGSA